MFISFLHSTILKALGDVEWPLFPLLYSSRRKARGLPHHKGPGDLNRGSRFLLAGFLMDPRFIRAEIKLASLVK